MRYAILCDSAGQTTCGTDGKIPIDGRLGRARAMQAVNDYRATFRAHFPHKLRKWTHVMFTQSITGEATPIPVDTSNDPAPIDAMSLVNSIFYGSNFNRGEE